MANAKDITSGNSNILLVGDSGTWKTGFFGTIAEALGPGAVYVFDFDHGMATVRGKDIEYNSFRDAAKDRTPRFGLYKWATGWPEFIKKLNELGSLIDKGQGPKVIGLDSLTFMSELAMNHVLSVQDKPIAHQGSYGAQQQYIKQVLGELTAWPVRLVATAHIQRDTNDITQVQEKLPLLTGKLAGLISAYFDEVYFTNAEQQADGKQKFTVSTSATPSMRQAKSRWQVPNNTLTDWKEISKFLPALPAASPIPSAISGVNPPALKLS